jgi:hypothetical protein
VRGELLWYLIRTVCGSVQEINWLKEDGIKIVKEDGKEEREGVAGGKTSRA